MVYTHLRDLATSSDRIQEHLRHILSQIQSQGISTTQNAINIAPLGQRARSEPEHGYCDFNLDKDFAFQDTDMEAKNAGTGNLEEDFFSFFSVQRQWDFVPLQHSTVAGTVLQTDSGYASLRRTEDEKRTMDADPQGADVD